jgi:hypothetical protein
VSINIIPTYQVMQFASIIQTLLQQKTSKLRGYVTIGNYVGKQASPVDQVGAIAMQPVTTRFAAMGRVDAPTDRRWVFPSDFDLPQLIDSFDKLRLLTDPTSTWVQNAVMAANRQYDDLIIPAFFANAATGEQGGTSTAHPAGQQIAVNFGAASNTGLTVAKLREARRILMANEVDLESDPVTVVVKAKQHDNLLAEAQVISLDFNEKPALVDGMVTRFLGFNIIRCERLAQNGSSQDRIPAFAKSGMHLGIWNDIATDISQRKDLQGLPWQAYVTMTAGATRLEEKKVVEIICA